MVVAVSERAMVPVAAAASRSVRSAPPSRTRRAPPRDDRIIAGGRHGQPHAADGEEEGEDRESRPVAPPYELLAMRVFLDRHQEPGRPEASPTHLEIPSVEASAAYDRGAAAVEALAEGREFLRSGASHDSLHSAA
jgi:hypothetical protein